MKTIREQIIERLITQLKTITTTNGYHNNIGPVYRQESVIQHNHGISIWELSESRKRNRYGGTERILILKIEAIIEINKNKHPATVSNELLGDIEKALILCDTTMDELIDDIQDIRAEIIQIPIEKKLAGASIDFEIKYTTEWGDPYTTGQTT
ncbi:hypothetical protein PN36_04580 [Candidatus Thiomargarita nelsonii]|uniref:Uncharacterized protein n=1 Tax=Candidatus Thiomargarita nelsonii TaxID=1003181 RepID=A0A0A6PLS1_9GAMM|nr:hypothetical protein PN36_04580 [Candidatus Thiomargarita nelsonii]